MTPLNDPILLAKFQETLREWNCDGFIQWKRLPAEWLRANLEGMSQKAVGRLMCEHVDCGGEIDQVVETREEYRHHSHHYDFRIRIGGRLVYIETCLHKDRMGPILYVVNMHDG